ncbi:avidin/streptavidin family protein [Bradyrhizobium septentrionale]|nr:avidin/streptavidin family protein [Bradyrhizobium septentrionale]UGY20144.1 avidin/streptavidin family protein [Bradyrhizobium septentrionale]UGY28992.1 avidin/streptavidin family protein [Bradyrhizobium septentrionale]
MDSTMSQEIWKLTHYVASVCVLLLDAAENAQPTWTWTNQYGSTLTVNSYGQSTGARLAPTRNASNSSDGNVPQAMTGWLAQTNQGTAISFAVNFSCCGSTTV